MKDKKGKGKRFFKSNRSHVRLLKKIGKISAQRSILESKILGLSITYLENGIIYQEDPEGNRKEIGRI